MAAIRPAPDREQLVAMLAALHRTNPAAVRLPRREIGLSWRGDLETALRELDQPWTGGPFTEPARALLAGTAGQVRRRLDTLDRWARDAADARTVITHGEPHPGNVIRVPPAPADPSAACAFAGPGQPSASAGPGPLPASAGPGQPPAEMMLIDWDTVALAPPERDLWLVASETGDELRRYTELTGRPVDVTALELYRLRWALDDISCFLRDLRAPHRRTAGTEHAWQALELSIAQITQ